MILEVCEQNTYILRIMNFQMKEPVLIVLLCLAAFSSSAPFNELFSYPTIELEGKIDQHHVEDASGVVMLQSGPVSVSGGRDSTGTLSGGLGMYESGQFSFGNFGKLSVKATTTPDHMYRALMDVEVFNGARSYNPMTLILRRNPNGVEYSGSSELGYFGGSYIASTQSNVIPKFEVHLNTNGYVTAMATGTIKDRQVQMDSYDAGINMGFLSGALNLDGNRNVNYYELGASLGFIHGTMKIDRANKRSYKAGLSLGVVNFDTEIHPDNSRSYNTELDTGILRFSYNVDKDDTSNWKGSLDMANLGIDYERTKEGLSIAGGRIQVGSSVINIHRDSNGMFTVKVNQGSAVE